jgi:hypothetical protein
MRFDDGLGFDVPWLSRTRQGALVILMVSVIAAVTWLRYTIVWTPLQRPYLHAYVRTSIRFVGDEHLDVLVIVDGTQSRWAMDDDVKPVLTNDHTTSFVLARAVDHTAAAHLEWRRYEAPALLHAGLKQWIYGNQSLFDLVFPPVRAAFDVALMFVIVLLSKDLAEAQSARLRPWEHPPSAHTRPDHKRPPVHAEVRSTPFFS